MKIIFWRMKVLKWTLLFCKLQSMWRSLESNSSWPESRKGGRVEKWVIGIDRRLEMDEDQELDNDWIDWINSNEWIGVAELSHTQVPGLISIIQSALFRMHQAISLFSPWILVQIVLKMTVLESAHHKVSETLPSCLIWWSFGWNIQG